MNFVLKIDDCQGGLKAMKTEQKDILELFPSRNAKEGRARENEN